MVMDDEGNKGKLEGFGNLAEKSQNAKDARTSQKPPLTSKKSKQNEPNVEAIESDDKDLSPDTSKPTKQRKKKQLKLQDAHVHPKAKTNKAKKPPAPRVLGAEPGPKSKKTPEQMESDNFSLGDKGPKAAAGSSKHPPIKPIIATILPESSGAPTYHPTTPLDSNKGSMDEVNNPAIEMQEDSPPKTVAQHSNTSGSEHGDEHDEDAHVEKDVEMQYVGEILEDELEDDSPKTSQGMGDPDDEEEGDQSMCNFDVEPIEDKDEERDDDANKERNLQEDRFNKIQSKSKTQIAEWEASTESIAKSVELEKAYEKNKKEVEACDKNIEAWEQQIKELQTKIVKAKERKEKLLKLDGDTMAKEVQIDMHHVERSQKLGEEIDILTCHKSGWERRLQLQKSKYQKMKESLPF
ncbi:uncharacterized protein LOC127094129 [Lathyrus oleraceus]|uniref:uncharacterized protein LOC127094129 n=1 Tax=Pisum sativum TaxID=3888 RepID=UPI0021CEE84E|nr:uncharacterized protein LOC127094129 [Pisum sativum]